MSGWGKCKSLKERNGYRKRDERKRERGEWVKRMEELASSQGVGGESLISQILSSFGNLVHWLLVSSLWFPKELLFSLHSYWWGSQMMDQSIFGANIHISIWGSIHYHIAGNLCQLIPSILYSVPLFLSFYIIPFTSLSVRSPWKCDHILPKTGGIIRGWT